MDGKGMDYEQLLFIFPIFIIFIFYTKILKSSSRHNLIQPLEQFVVQF